MNCYINNRVLEEALYFTSNNKTIRDVASIFGVSKSTVHKDLKERLPLINVGLFNQVLNIFNKHISVRHIKGGEATKNKYKYTDS